MKFNKKTKMGDASTHILVRRKHPYATVNRNSKMVFLFMILIPLIFHFLNISSRLDTTSWQIAILIEIGIAILVFITANLIIIVFHYLLKLYYQSRNKKEYTLASYFQVLNLLGNLFILVLIAISFSDSFFTLIPILFSLVLVSVYILSLVPLYVDYAKNRTLIILGINQDQTLRLVHGFEIYRISYYHTLEFDKDSTIPLLLFSLVKENDKWYNKSYEYRSLEYNEISEETVSNAIYVPISKDFKRLALVDNQLDRKELDDLLRKINEVKPVEGVSLKLPLSKDNFTDFHEGKIDIAKTLEVKRYSLNLIDTLPS